jgi:hypothetical protein
MAIDLITIESALKPLQKRLIGFSAKTILRQFFRPPVFGRMLRKTIFPAICSLIGQPRYWLEDNVTVTSVGERFRANRQGVAQETRERIQ